MAYVPTDLNIATWGSPINIVGSDNVTNLDEAVNQIITSDAQSLVNHVNTEMAKITPYLSAELAKIYTEVDSRVVAAEAAKIAAQAAQAAAEAAQTAAETAKTAAEAAQAAAAASAAAALASQNAAAASAAASSGSADSSAASASASAASAAAALASQNAAAASQAAAATSETNSQLREWEAEAWKLTAQSYAVEAEDVPVNLVTSDGDGTFTYTPQTGVYSALHHQTKGLAQDASLKVNRAGDTMTGNLEAPSMSIGGKYVSPHSFKNKFINGGFDIWQRGTSFNSTGASKYSVDRWIVYGGGGDITLSRVTTSQDFATYVAKFTVTTAGVGANLHQRIENVKTLNGKKLTVSFKLYGDGSSKTFDVKVRQNFGTGGSEQIETNTQSVSTTNGVWTDHVLTFDVPSVSGKTIGSDSYLGVMFMMGESLGNSNIAKVQVEEGTVATPFEERPIGLELSLCQRYYEKSYNQDVFAGESIRTDGNEAFTSLSTYLLRNPIVKYRVIKRTSPTVSVYSTHSGVVGKLAEFNTASVYQGDVTISASTLSHTGFSIGSVAQFDATMYYRGQWTADAEL